jgi:cobalt-zinc-cadmium efflux system membrane fusion protein
MKTNRHQCGPALALALALAACHSHDHPHDHEHGPGAGAAEAEDGPSLAITRWTPRYELFVELPAPTPGKPVAYHAHVTELVSFAAVTRGTFKVRYKTQSAVVQEHVQDGVARPGIFAFEGPAPAAGRYQLEMEYARDGQVDVFDCGAVDVGAPATAAQEVEGATSITFLKESQWKIPFGTGWAEERPLANELELPASIEPAASDQLTVAAPTGGRFFHNPQLALAEGLRIRRGDLLGTIAPTVAGDDYSRLQAAVDEARLAREQLQRELERVTPLVTSQLLPERRVLQLKNELESENRRLSAAAARLRRVEDPAGAGGLVIRSGSDGVVAQVLVPNGAPVEGGAALVRVAGTDHLWLRARFVAKPVLAAGNAVPVGVRLASGERVELEPLGARFLSPLPVIDPVSRIATWIVDVPASEAPAAVAASGLRVGTSVVLAVRFGAREPLLAVPRSAAVEINTRPYVFVQKDGEHFERRAVTLGRVDGPYVQILSGVAQGERVVTRGAYDIHLASLLGTIESHRH